jgi:hypothetical protein
MSATISDWTQRSELHFSILTLAPEPKWRRQTWTSSPPLVTWRFENSLTFPENLNSALGGRWWWKLMNFLA